MAALPDPGRSRAVLIGASTYRHLEDLPAVRNNLSGFRDVLVAPALGGLPADHCTVVAEPARPVDVYRTLRQQAAAAEDTLLVYFTGHGKTGSRNELWLCLPGTDPDELPYSAWPYDELRRVVADSRAAKKVVILDCCFSGRALADQAGDEETILGQVGIEGTYLLTATAANRVALAPPGERYTAFTGILLGLLTKGIPGGPELLTFGQIYPRLQYTLTSRQLPRPRQQGSDTIAHLALTRNLAYTERSRALNERLTAITAQLGDNQPAIRQSVIYDLARLADDWEEHRQTCVDLLCGYLRMPYEPWPDYDNRAERAAYLENQKVRHYAIEVITRHLQADSAVSWQGLNFDFTGVVFDGGSFAGAVFSSGGTVDFTGAEFAGDTVSFYGAMFSGGTVNFTGAKFSADTVDFRRAEFGYGPVNFVRAEFSGGTVNFSRARFSGGTVDFTGARFSADTVDFADAEFSGGPVDFGGAEFSGREVSFSRAEFSGAPVHFTYARFFAGSTVDFTGARFSFGGTVNFIHARFAGGKASFRRAEFSGGTVSFRRAVFSGGTVSFDDAEFSGGVVTFSSAKFSGGTVSFDGARFSGGTVDFGRTGFSAGTVSFDDAGFSGAQVGFDRAEFSGGRVDFARIRRWSHPPMFSWDGEPPAGVILPVQPIEETKSQLEQG